MTTQNDVEVIETNETEQPAERLTLPWDSDGLYLLTRHKSLTYEMFAKQQTVPGTSPLAAGPLKGKIVDVKYNRQFCANRIASIVLGVLQTTKEQDESLVPNFDRVSVEALSEFLANDVVEAVQDIIEQRHAALKADEAEKMESVQLSISKKLRRLSPEARQQLLAELTAA